MRLEGSGRLPSSCGDLRSKRRALGAVEIVSLTVGDFLVGIDGRALHSLHFLEQALGGGG